MKEEGIVLLLEKEKKKYKHVDNEKLVKFFFIINYFENINLNEFLRNNNLILINTGYKNIKEKYKYDKVKRKIKTDFHLLNTTENDNFLKNSELTEFGDEFAKLISEFYLDDEIIKKTIAKINVENPAAGTEFKFTPSSTPAAATPAAVTPGGPGGPGAVGPGAGAAVGGSLKPQKEEIEEIDEIEAIEEETIPKLKPISEEQEDTNFSDLSTLNIAPLPSDSVPVCLSEISTDSVPVSLSEISTDSVPVSLSEISTDSVPISSSEISTDSVPVSLSEISVESI